MRVKLQEIEEVRDVFTGTFTKFGTKPNGWHQPLKTVLLVDIKDAQGEVVTDHLWFNNTKGFDALILAAGDQVEFRARVKPYEKGYRGWNRDEFDSPIETDYKLSHPTKVRKLTQGDQDVL